jgi:hypothetical protein
MSMRLYLLKIGVDLSAVHKGFDNGNNIRQLYPHVVFCIKPTAVPSICS